MSTQSTEPARDPTMVAQARLQARRLDGPLQELLLLINMLHLLYSTPRDFPNCTHQEHLIAIFKDEIQKLKAAIEAFSDTIPDCWLDCCGSAELIEQDALLKIIRDARSFCDTLLALQLREQALVLKTCLGIEFPLREFVSSERIEEFANIATPDLPLTLRQDAQSTPNTQHG